MSCKEAYSGRLFEVSPYTSIGRSFKSCSRSIVKVVPSWPSCKWAPGHSGWESKVVRCDADHTAPLFAVDYRNLPTLVTRLRWTFDLFLMSQREIVLCTGR